MHDYTDEIVGGYIKKHYTDFESMTHCELDELYKLSKIYHNLLIGDEAYHEIVEMEKTKTT